MLASSKTPPEAYPARNFLERLADEITRSLQQPWCSSLVISLLLGLLFLGARGADPDLFARLAVGRLIATEGIYLYDPFSFSPTKSVWIDHEWLSGVIFFYLYSWGDDPALFVFKLLIAGHTVLLVARAGRLLGNRPVSWGWLVVTLIPCAYLWLSTVRSQVFTYWGIAYLFYAVFEYQRNRVRRYIWLLPPLFFLWANAHGGFVVGLGFLGILILFDLFARRPARELMVIGVLSLGATCLSPYGAWAYWEYILEAVTMPRPHIDEWAPLYRNWRDVVWPMAVAVSILAALFSGARIEARGLVLLLVCLVAGVRSFRFIGLFFIVASVWAGPAVQSLVMRMCPWQHGFGRKLQRALALAALSGCVFSIIRLSTSGIVSGNFVLDRSGYPVEALRWIRETYSGGRILVDFTLGSYALWEVYPRFLVAIDGRYEEVYTEETVQTAMRALDLGAPGHVVALATVDPDFVVVQAEQADQDRIRRDWAIGTATGAKRFEPVYSDATYLIFQAQSIDLPLPQ